MSVNLHTTSEPDPLVRGRELGHRWRREIQQTLADYTWLFTAAGLSAVEVRRVAEGCQAELAAWAPDLALEIEGIATGAALEPWQAAALNARTEIVVRGAIAGLKECTTAVWLPPAGPPHSLQTWDWIPSVNNVTVRRHRSSERLWVVTMAENGVLAKVGVNSSRLGLLLTLLCHTSDGAGPGVPVHAVARRVLDEATSIADAVAIARSARLTASAAMTIVQYDGERTTGVVLELSPDGVATREPVDGFLLHTNHFLDPSLAQGDRLAAIGDDTLPRLARLEELRDALRAEGRTAIAAGLVSHWADGAPICAHPRPDAPETNRWETKMMLSLDLVAPALGLHEGGPCGVTESGWQDVAA
jgi:isopenicillin-N N-acyltransferase-like protein